MTTASSPNSSEPNPLDPIIAAYLEAVEGSDIATIAFGETIENENLAHRNLQNALPATTNVLISP